MNYIKQVNTFYELLPNNPLSSNAQCLYFYLLNLNNRLGWIEEFTVANSLICGYVNYNRQILDRARNELVQKGYIKYSKGKSNQAGKYSIVKFNTQNNTQDNTQDNTQNNTQDNTQDNTQNVHTTIPLNKLNINKTNTPKSPIEVEEDLSKVNLYSNWKENLQCDCISKSTNTRCLRKSTYNINGKNYCNQHSRDIMAKIVGNESKQEKKPWVSSLELPDNY